MAEWSRVLALSELPAESIKRVKVGTTPVLLCHTAGVVHAVSDTCSHEDVSLSFGCLKDGAIKCGYHGSRFCLKTGQPQNEPATAPIPVFAARVNGDMIEVSLEPSHD
jgi:3-phenylpropionate/trans-cinnamate dioxygenase ferredoxin subunit